MDGKDEQLQTMLATNRAVWDAVAEQFVGSTALPEYGPLAPTEETLHLLPDLRGRRVLELGCGSGHSLIYLARHGAAELWALDFSAVQIAHATALLHEHRVDARLFRSPMEENPGIPIGYFDLIVSVYALGWTVDLTRTLSLVTGYLRPGGVLIFSWAHPVYRSLGYEAGRFVLERPYGSMEPEREADWRGAGPVVWHVRRLGTFVNALVNAGLVVDRLLEPDVDVTRAQPDDADPERWYSIPRAQLVPTTFIIRAHKPD